MQIVIRAVVISRNAQKQLRRMPQRIVDKLLSWAQAVEAQGLEKVRKFVGYHDEPLQGKRLGQRSIRLSLSYRAIYVIKHAEIEFVSIEEVSKHDY